MLLISPYEYCFTIFEKPIAHAHNWDLPSVATTYTIYIIVASLTMIPSGLWSDRWQPRWFTTVADVITGLGSAIFIPILTPVLTESTDGYKSAFIGMGIAMLVVIVVAAQFLKFPEKDWLPPGYDPAAD